VILHIAAHGSSLGLKTDKFAIAGDSVGGQMALAMCALTAARAGPKIVYQALFYPVTSTNAESSTYKTYADGPYLSAPLFAGCTPHFMETTTGSLSTIQANPPTARQTWLQR